VELVRVTVPPLFRMPPPTLEQVLPERVELLTVSAP